VGACEVDEGGVDAEKCRRSDDNVPMVMIVSDDTKPTTKQIKDENNNKGRDLEGSRDVRVGLEQVEIKSDALRGRVWLRRFSPFGR
jgi:hypothetical protein